MNKVTLILATTALLASGSGWTADDAEATIRLMGKAEAELPEAVTKEITLPAHLLDESTDKQARAVEKAARGLEKANQRNAHRENGQLQAEEARERSHDMNEKASENREYRGRSEDHPTPPESPPVGIMVGDSINDIVAAQQGNIPVIAVDFGYTDVPVSQLNPDLIISHFDELPDAVRQLHDFIDSRSN